MSKKILKRLLSFVYHVTPIFLKTNWVKTIYFNFKLLPFSIAIKLPVLIYGRILFYTLKGKLVISGKINTGMIQIGKDMDGFPASFLPVKFYLAGILKFNGPAVISGGSTITVWDGIIEIGKFCVIGSGISLKSVENIKIGDYTRVAGGCMIMDTNVHFLRNTSNGKIKKIFSKIEIGKYCWINMGTVVSKGTILPDYCIVARNSLLNKDYSLICPPASFLAGAPAIVKSGNVQRIFNRAEEIKLFKYFKENPDSKEYHSEPGIIEDGEVIFNLFRSFS